MYGKIIGRMIGGAAALLLSWPIEVVVVLALAGVLVGHLLLDLGTAEPKPPPSGTAEQATLARLLCPVFVELARDRLVVQAEVRLFLFEW